MSSGALADARGLCRGFPLVETEPLIADRLLVARSTAVRASPRPEHAVLPDPAPGGGA